MKSNAAAVRSDDMNGIKRMYVNVFAMVIGHGISGVVRCDGTKGNP